MGFHFLFFMSASHYCCKSFLDKHIRCFGKKVGDLPLVSGRILVDFWLVEKYNDRVSGFLERFFNELEVT